MFHYEDAIGYACENRLCRELNDVDRYIQDIGKNQVIVDADYLEIVGKYENELKRRQKERDDQIVAIENRKNELQKKAEELTEKLTRINQKNKFIQRTVNTLKEKIALKEGEIERKKEQVEYNRNSLLAQTKILTDESTETFDAECKLLNTSRALLDCGGQLAKYIYFVRNKKDKNGMAELRKIPFSGQHTVFVYDDKDLSSNNLSEELSHFIKWFIDAVRRTNPAALLNKNFPVIDVVSGKSILSFPPYNRYVQVIADSREKSMLVDALKEWENIITSDVEDKGIRINNFDELNDVRMKNKNNLKDIAEQEDIAIADLWERPYPYNFIIFVVPRVNENGSQPSLLNDEFKSVLMNIQHYGIIPIFIVSCATWKDIKRSPDVAYLHSIQDKKVFNVYNVGKANEAKLDI